MKREAAGTPVGPFTVLPGPILHFEVAYNSASDSTGLLHWDGAAWSVVASFQ